MIIIYILEKYKDKIYWDWFSYNPSIFTYDYEKLKPLYKSFIKPKKIILGEDNRIEEDVLITNSKDLFEKYQSI